MKKKKGSIDKILRKNSADIVYLLIAGLPSGLLLMALIKWLDFSNLF